MDENITCGEGHVEDCPGRVGGSHEFRPGYDRYGKVASPVRYRAVDTGHSIEIITESEKRLLDGNR